MLNAEEKHTIFSALNMTFKIFHFNKNSFLSLMLSYDKQVEGTIWQKRKKRPSFTYDNKNKLDKQKTVVIKNWNKSMKSNVNLIKNHIILTKNANREKRQIFLTYQIQFKLRLKNSLHVAFLKAISTKWMQFHRFTNSHDLHPGSNIFTGKFE